MDFTASSRKSKLLLVCEFKSASCDPKVKQITPLIFFKKCQRLLDVQKAKLKTLSQTHTRCEVATDKEQSDGGDQDSFVIRAKPFASFCGRLADTCDQGKLKTLESEFISVSKIYNKMSERLGPDDKTVLVAAVALFFVCCHFATSMRL